MENPEITRLADLRDERLILGDRKARVTAMRGIDEQLEERLAECFVRGFHK